jgi:hypothetical protein
LLATVLGACAAPSPPLPPAVLYGLEAQLPTIERVQLRGAGGATLVTLERGEHAWTVAERGGWPADRMALRTLLADAAGARALESRTDQPDKHARIGVEDIAAADAAGVEVRLEGDGWAHALVVGEAPLSGRGRFVRVAGTPQSWLTDRPFAVAREPVAWLDTRLLDVPLPQVVAVQSRDAEGHAFTLEHREDRFRITDLPNAAMGDSYRGDTLAGVLGDLRLEDVAADDGATAERTVRFALHDGSAWELDAWRVDGRYWVRVRACTGVMVCAAPARFANRRFLLPAHVAPRLLLTREAILADEEPAMAEAPAP